MSRGDSYTSSAIAYRKGITHVVNLLGLAADRAKDLDELNQFITYLDNYIIENEYPDSDIELCSIHAFKDSYLETFPDREWELSFS